MKKQSLGVSLLWASLSLVGCGGEGGTTVVVEEPSSSSSSGSSSASSSSSGGWLFGSFDDESIPAELQPLIDQYAALTSLDAAEGMPVRLTPEQFATLVKNGLRKDAALAYPVAPTQPSSSSSSGQVQVPTISSPQSFVVASDPVKIGLRNTKEVFDGRYWFVSSVSNLGRELNLDILEVEADTANIRSLIDFKLVGNNPFRFEGVKSLNLVRNQAGETSKLVLVAQTSPPDNNEPLDYYNKPIDIYFVGVEDLMSPQNSNKLTIRGQVLASHQYGNTLYLFTQRQPALDGIIMSGSSLAEAMQANEALINSTPVNDLFPSRADASECYAPAYVDSTSVDSLIDIVAINLDTESIAFTDCLAATTQGVYFDDDRFYTWASRSRAPRDKTVLYEFALQSDAITPVAWGSVDSRIVEKHYLPQKKIHAADGKIQLIATNSGNQNKFYLLGEGAEAGRLDVLGSLPNAEHPEPIGFGKTIFGASFIGDKTYIATINGMDYGLSSINPPGPTYVVNTADSANPILETQLQLTDYASFIKPLTDNYLLTVSRAGPGSYDARVDLLDVSDHQAPQVIRSQSFSAPAGESSSGGPLTNAPAIFNDQSVAVVQTGDDAYRVAVPFDFTARTNNQVSAATDMLFFQVSGLDSVPDLTLLGQVQSHEYTCGDSFSEGYGCIYGYLRSSRRSIVLENSLFYFYEGAENVGPTAITSFDWDNFNGIVKRASLGDSP